MSKCKIFCFFVNYYYMWVLFYYQLGGKNWIMQMINVCYCIGFQGVIIYYIGVQFMGFIMCKDSVNFGVKQWIFFQQMYCFCYYIQCIFVCFQYFLFGFNNGR